MSASWHDARHILCIRLDTLGDVVMTSPAIRALRISASGRAVTLLTSSIGAEVGRLIPEVDQVIAYDAPWMKATQDRPDSAVDSAMIERLRRERFDGAVIFTSYGQSALPGALLCFLAEIPLRLAHARENPYQLLTNWVVDPEKDGATRHEVRRQLDLVSNVDAYTAEERLSVDPGEAARMQVRRLVEELSLHKRWAVIHPGARASSRRYPPDLYAKVARELTDRFGWQLVFTGSSDEQPLIDRIRLGLTNRTVSLAGQLDLPELVALIEAAPLLIANNTGPAHLAAAVGTPVVDLYALTNPQHTPWAVPSRVLYHDVPCRNCLRSICPEKHHNCLALVPPTEVVAAAHELITLPNRQPSLSSSS